MRYYPPDWNERRRRAIVRDGFRCLECGVRGGPTTDVSLHVHHVRPVEEGGGHALANLATLCEECHTRYHGGD